MTDEQIAELLYSDGSPEKPAGETAEVVNGPQVVGDRSLEDLSKIIYPPQSPRFAQVSDDGKVASVIRDVEGNILHGGEGASTYTDIRAMIQFNAQQLNNASLTDIDFASRDLRNAKLAGADLKNSSFHGSLAGSDLKGADLRGVSFVDADLRGVDLTDAEVDHLTDLEGADLSGAKYSYQEIRRCKNWDKARGLRMNAK